MRRLFFINLFLVLSVTSFSACAEHQSKKTKQDLPIAVKQDLEFQIKTKFIAGVSWQEVRTALEQEKAHPKFVHLFLSEDSSSYVVTTILEDNSQKAFLLRPFIGEGQIVLWKANEMPSNLYFKFLTSKAGKSNEVAEPEEWESQKVEPVTRNDR